MYLNMSINFYILVSIDVIIIIIIFINSRNH